MQTVRYLAPSLGLSLWVLSPVGPRQELAPVLGPLSCAPLPNLLIWGIDSDTQGLTGSKRKRRERWRREVALGFEPALVNSLSYGNAVCKSLRLQSSNSM